LVECTGFENRKSRKVLGGSNPPASVNFSGQRKNLRHSSERREATSRAVSGVHVSLKQCVLVHVLLRIDIKNSNKFWRGG
jgi:hypothetical protein